MGKMLYNKKGFTLVELTVAIAIIVILTALLLPAVIGYVSEAGLAAGKANAKTIYNAAVQIAATNKNNPGIIVDADATTIINTIGGKITELKISKSQPADSDFADKGSAYIQTDSNGVPIAAYFESSAVKYPE